MPRGSRLSLGLVAHPGGGREREVIVSKLRFALLHWMGRRRVGLDGRLLRAATMILLATAQAEIPV